MSLASELNIWWGKRGEAEKGKIKSDVTKILKLVYKKTPAKSEIDHWWGKLSVVEKILVKDTIELMRDKNADPDKTEKYKEALRKTFLERDEKRI